MGKLFIVPTPIGNLGDITLRAIEVLKTAELILAEDTRQSGILLRHYGIRGKVWSHHKFNEHGSVEKIAAMIGEGMVVALISDAGTPGISDPGFLLVRSCLAKGINVETLPGATALIPALIDSGLPCDRFCFEGFLPQKKGKRKKIELLASEPRTMVFYESPFRIADTLSLMSEVFGGDRNASISRELSKLHSETIRGTLNEIVEVISGRELKGEFVIVVAGEQARKRKSE
ncbi:MAG: 16S rRNA (cytidine(1402)-2'-O)-methyltransferase [Bacteroidales bacterium]|jgi:16S rRNA (cytidine1402-2'-O)-methyltransferase|nr:16S rRNA (cytidine(1402)-2'-O)-methyltransferase [Bacteroidales bacterium]